MPGPVQLPERDLVCRAFPIGAGQLRAQVYIGPCILESVWQMIIGNATQWTIYDGIGAGVAIVMRGDGLGQVQPFAFPLINVRLNYGLYFEQPTSPTGWTFNLWTP